MYRKKNILYNRVLQSLHNVTIRRQVPQNKKTYLAFALNSLPLLLLASLEFLLFLALLPREFLLSYLVIKQLQFGHAALLLDGGLELPIQRFDRNCGQRLARALFLAQPQRYALETLVDAYPETDQNL